MTLLTIPPIDLIAFDPGKQTGVAWVKEGELVRTEKFDEEDLIELCGLSCEGFDVPVYVVEQFRLYPGMQETLTHATMVSPMMIGAIRVMAKFFDIPIHFQSASQAKTFATDALLKEYGFYVPNEHKRDAARHAFYYLVHEGRRCWLKNTK